MRIFALAELASDWYPKNALMSFQRYSNFRFVQNPAESDLVWIFSYYFPLDSIAFKPLKSWLFGHGEYRRRREFAGKPVITSVHHLAPNKECEFLPHIKRADGISDAIQFFSRVNAVSNRRHFTKPVFLMPYWIDLELFSPVSEDEKKATRRKYSLPEDKIILGSFQRDTEPDLVTPKTEKGPDVFADICENLGRGYHVLLSGVRRNYLEGRLHDAGMPYTNLGKIPHERMRELYGCLDFYLVTSRVEGGPQAILEAMATGTPIYSTEVGISDALVPAVICRSADEFLSALSGPYPDAISRHLDTVRNFEVKKVVEKFETVFAALIEAAGKGEICLPEVLPGLDWVVR